MNPVSSLKKYRLAKKLVDDLETMVSLLNETKAKLKPYRHYYPMRTILENIVRNQEILSVHLKRQKLVITNKGNVEDEQ